MTKANDYPIEKCIRTAAPFIEAGCQVHQKFTCAKCGSRQTMEDQNVFHASGRCEECGHVTDIIATGCSYLIKGPSDVITRIQMAVAPIPHVIRAVAFANGVPCPIAGQWLRSFDFEYGNGRGDGYFVTDPRKAKVFDSQADAIAFWNTVSKCKPVREDGQPNKPLTSTTFEITPRDAAIKAWRKK
jgi:hypothetical protein